MKRNLSKVCSHLQDKPNSTCCLTHRSGDCNPPGSFKDGQVTMKSQVSSVFNAHFVDNFQTRGIIRCTSVEIQLTSNSARQWHPTRKSRSTDYHNKQLQPVPTDTETTYVEKIGEFRYMRSRITVNLVSSKNCINIVPSSHPWKMRFS